MAGANSDRAYVALMQQEDRRREGHPLANLVAQHFLPPAPSQSHFIWYRDGDTFNCAADNLYWTTRVVLNLTMLDPDTGEEWRNVANWPDYHVSSHGRMRRAVMTSLMDSGARMEKQYSYRVGGRYVAVNLTRDKKKSQVMIHHLVCQTFHGPAPTEEHVVWFHDGDSLNSHADNLSWLTHAEASCLVDAELGLDEEWRPVPRYDGYEASSEGRIRHQKRDQKRIREGHTLKAVPNKQRKLMVSVRVGDHSVPKLVHSLVAAAFLPPPPNTYAFIVHKDGNEANSRPENLEWITSRQAYTRRYKSSQNDISRE